MVPDINLNDGNHMPQLGFGVFQIPEADTARAVGHALETGYRSIDTAAAYGNEAGVRDAVLTSELDRGELFITTKLRNPDHGRDRVPHAFEESLDKLGGELHRPVPDPLADPGQGPVRRDLGRRCALSEGGAASGRSESRTSRSSISSGSSTPRVSCPRSTRSSSTRISSSSSCAGSTRSTGSRPRPGARSGKAQFLDDATIQRIASAHGRTPAQVVLRWHIQLGNIVIPKSVTPSRIEENFRIFDFELSEDDMHALFELDREERTGPDPDTFG